MTTRPTAADVSFVEQLSDRIGFAIKRRVSMPEWHRPTSDEPVLRAAVFSVEDTTAQIVWGNALPGTITVDVAPTDASGTVSAAREQHRGDGGPGGLIVAGLAPDTRHRVTLTHDEGRSWSVELAAHTLAPPPGATLARLATVNDMHVGSRGFGVYKTMVTRMSDPDPPGITTTRGALLDIAAWAPEQLVVKGDMTNKGTLAQWADLHELLDLLPVPMIGMAGNHERYQESEIDPAEGWRPAGTRFADPVTHLDVEGARIIAMDSSVPRRSSGSLERCREQALDLAAETSDPVLLFLHHPLEQRPLPSQYPPGVPWDEAEPFRQELARANPATLVSCGHTHRNRVHRHGPLVLTEVASTKDYPGVWGGYVVHEGGIRQVVRRTTEPAAMSWTEYSRWAVLGGWGRYSPGTMTDRCFSHTWPRVGRRDAGRQPRVLRTVSATN